MRPEPYEPSWRDHANCLGLDADLFFPERGAPDSQARAVCAACTVRVDCLAYALDNRINVGIWGGLSARQRRWLRITGAASA